MSTHITDESRFHSWEATPEPSQPKLDPRVVLDGNIDGQAWLYNTREESTQWLTYYGETVAVEQ